MLDIRMIKVIPFNNVQNVMIAVLQMFELKIKQHAITTNLMIKNLLCVFQCFPAVFNLTNNIDVENTKLRMEQYQKENKNIIQKNKAKLVCAFKFIHN